MNNPAIEPNTRLLVIDDNAAIHEDFRKILNPGQAESPALDDAESILFGDKPEKPRQISFEIDSAFQGKEGLAMVERACVEGRPYAMAFVDVRMPPGWDGIETIGYLWKAYPELQVVICTAYSDYSWTQIAEKLGHCDSLLILRKPFDTIEVLQLAHALTRKWLVTRQASLRLDDLECLVKQRTAELLTTNESLEREIGERVRTEEELRLSEERFGKAFHASPLAMAIQTADDERLMDVNATFLKMTSFTREEVIDRTADQLSLWAEAKTGRALSALLHAKKGVRNFECKMLIKSGEAREACVSIEPFELSRGSCLLVIIEDITDQRALEGQLRQAQKMEAVGNLAAGVAHDFNNILTVIQGHTSMQLSSKNAHRNLRESLEQILRASERAAALTRQLLAFSRKQLMEARVIDFNEIVTQLTSMLRRLIGENIELRCECAPDVWRIFADPSQLEQIIMNLALNARDAMASGGTLTIHTANASIEPQTGKGNTETRPGRFVRLSVSDTGCGMTPAVKSQIFEPFFTTKEVGKGTGMGLAMVHGVVKQHQGWIEVESTPGAGATFHIYLPATELPKEAAIATVTTPAHVTGQTTVLVVEDDPALNELVTGILEYYGYSVLAATTGAQALELWEEHGKKINLLLTDVVMPGISGRELADLLKAKAPTLPVIYTSGYPKEHIAGEGRFQEGINYLSKPYHPTKLAQILGETLKTAEQVPVG